MRVRVKLQGLILAPKPYTLTGKEELGEGGKDLGCGKRGVLWYGARDLVTREKELGEEGRKRRSRVRVSEVGYCPGALGSESAGEAGKSPSPSNDPRS